MSTFFADFDRPHVTLRNNSLTEKESSSLQRNIEHESPEVTHSGSKLAGIDVNTTSDKEITHKFCREAKFIYLRYAEHYKV